MARALRAPIGSRLRRADWRPLRRDAEEHRALAERQRQAAERAAPSQENVARRRSPARDDEPPVPGGAWYRGRPATSRPKDTRTALRGAAPQKRGFFPPQDLVRPAARSAHPAPTVCEREGVEGGVGALAGSFDGARVGARALR